MATILRGAYRTRDTVNHLSTVYTVHELEESESPLAGNCFFYSFRQEVAAGIWAVGRASVASELSYVLEGKIDFCPLLHNLLSWGRPS